MKITPRLLAVLGLLSTGALAWADDAPTPVLAPNVRKEMVAQADSVLTARPLGLAANLADPFHSPAFAEATGHAVKASPDAGVQVKLGPKSEREILQGIASGLKPTGNFVVNGEPTLFFGQKRVKPGTTLTINFEGAEYIVEIVSIDHANFTLRLNREEFTRPIK